MNRFACNSVTSEALRFTVRIEQFSLYVLRGYFISPEFESESSDTKWSLVVGVNDGSDYDNYIEVRLRRDEFSCEEQLVKAKVAIVGFPNLPLLTEVCEKDLFFGEGRKDAQVLTVTKKRLFGFFGMNKLRLLPKDTLTLVCELVIHKYHVQTFDRRRDFENVAGHQGPAGTVEYFAHISMERKTFDFVRRFRNFSEHHRRGRCVSPQFQKEHSEYSDCKWSLVVRAYDWEFTDGSFDIRLQRSDSNGTGQFVEVELSIVDGNDKTLKFEEKSVYFRGSPDEESPILTIAKKDMSGWFGFSDVFNQSRLINDDTLTLKCKITEYEETVNVFDSKYDFGGYRGSLLTYLKSACAYLFCVALFLLIIIYSAYYVALPFITDYVQPLIVDILLYTSLAGIITFVLFWIKNKAENRIEEKKLREKAGARNDRMRRQNMVNENEVTYKMMAGGTKNNHKLIRYR